MSLKVEFFQDDLVDAVGAGIYEIYVKKDDKLQLIYVGESVFVLVRCGTHLYEIKKGKGYLGFTKDFLDNYEIELVFKLNSLEADRTKRKANEKEIIKEKNPLQQSGVSDRTKTVEQMINDMAEFLE